MRFLLFALLFLMQICSFAQIGYERGYLIKNNGDTVNCLVKNKDWRYNPKKISYKVSETSETLVADINDIKEFGVLGISQYHKFIVNIDGSSQNINDLSYQREPEFSLDTLFLKLLVSGKAQLYKYEDGGGIKLFLKTDAGSIQQLIFKEYRAEGSAIEQNNTFREQLATLLENKDIILASLGNLKYRESEIAKLILAYNGSQEGYERKNFIAGVPRKLFAFTVKGGLNMANLMIQSDRPDYPKIDFGNKIGLRIGVETEFAFSFNKNKWAIFLDPNFQYYKAERNDIAFVGYKANSADYKSIELPVGLRYYLFLNNKSKFFIDGAVNVDFGIGSNKIKVGPAELDSKSIVGFSFGVGYNYNKRCSIEMRYRPLRNVLIDYAYWQADYKVLSAILGFRIF